MDTHTAPESDPNEPDQTIQTGGLESSAVPPAPPAEERKRNRWLVPLIAVGVVAAVTAAGATYLGKSSKSPMEQAYENCNGSQSFTRVIEHGIAEEGGPTPTKSPSTASEEPEEENEALAKYFEGVLELEDDGKTLIIDSLGQEEDPLGLGAVVADCVYIDLETPKWVSESVGATRAMDGRQSAEWDNYKAQWSYHPDSGLSMIITTVEK